MKQSHCLVMGLLLVVIDSSIGADVYRLISGTCRTPGSPNSLCNSFLRPQSLNRADLEVCSAKNPGFSK